MNKKELKKAYDEGLINIEQYKDRLFKLEIAPKPKRKAKRVYEAVSEEDFIQIIKTAKKKEHKLGFVLGFGAGLRISEIVGGKRSDGTVMEKLQPEEIHPDKKKIFVRQAKGMKDRTTYCPRWIKKSDLKYFPLKISRRSLQDAFTRISIKAGVNWKVGSYMRNGKEVPIYRYHFHCLRSSFVTRLLDENIPAHQVMNLAGHENMATTTKYAKANPNKAIDEIFEKGL